MKKISEMTQGELGAFIQSHLRKKGIDVVLSGGAAVGIHSSRNEIDIDEIERWSAVEGKQELFIKIKDELLGRKK